MDQSSAPFANTSQPIGSGGINSSSLVPLTEKEIQDSLPTSLRSSVTQSLVDLVNNIAVDPLIAQNIRENFMSYTGILKEGKFKTEDYLNAVTYVSYKIMGYNNEEAYAKTFPARYANLVAKGTSKKDISSYVYAYHKNKLVNLILEQSLVPSWVLNQDAYQAAINRQVYLMAHAASEKVQQEAANSILTHLAKPKDGNFQISIGETESSGMREMRDALTQLAQTQKNAIVNGNMKTIDVAASKLSVVDQDNGN